MRRCPDCDGVPTAGLLYGPTAEPVRCVICWDCGWQTRAVYQRSEHERNDVGYDEAHGVCAWCDRPMVARRASQLRLHCSASCSNAHNHQQRKAERQAEMTRAAFLRRVS